MPPQPFVVPTNSEHEREGYLNLARRLKLSGLNQLWVAAITYLRLARELVLLEAFSRQVGGGA